MNVQDRYTVDLLIATLLLLVRACWQWSLEGKRKGRGNVVSMCVWCLFPSYEMLYLYITKESVSRNPRATV